MASTIVEISDELKTQLKAHAWSEDVTVERTWNPSKSLTDFKRTTPPLFSVIPADHKRTRLDTTSFGSWFQIDIGIRCRSDSLARSDELAELVQSVQTWCEDEFAPPGNWPLVDVELAPLFDSATLNTATVWFSVIRLFLGVNPKDAE